MNRTPYNAPGLLLWYRDGGYTFNALDANKFDPPSIGSKGETLLVDAHYEPERRRGEAAEVDPSLLNNLNSRVQAMDAAFGPVGRYPFRACIAPGRRAVRPVVQRVRAPPAGSARSPTRRRGTRAWSTGPTSTRRRRCSSGTSTRRSWCRRATGRSTRRGSSTRNGRLVRDLFGEPRRRRARARHGQSGGRATGRLGRQRPGHDGGPVARRAGAGAAAARPQPKAIVRIRPGRAAARLRRTPQPPPQPGRPGDRAVDGGADRLLGADQDEVGAGAGDGGVEQLAGEDR